MVNFGFGAASILGIFLAVAGAALYFLRSVRPELSRDHDIFFAAVGLLCGFILLFQGWRLDPILQFGQLLLTGSTIFFAVESVRLRGVATEQAKRNTPIVDDERPVSPFYRQEAQLYDYDELPEDDDRPIRPRIRPSRDSRAARADEYGSDRRSSSTDDYEEGTRRRPARSSSNSSQRLGQGDNRRRSSRPTSRPVEQPEDEWSSPKRSNEDWDDSGSISTPRNSNSSRSDRNSNPSSRPRKRRPPQDSSQRQSDVEATPTDYVDYRPVERLEEDPDNSANFDEV